MCSIVPRSHKKTAQADRYAAQLLAQLDAAAAAAGGGRPAACLRLLDCLSQPLAELCALNSNSDFKGHLYQDLLVAKLGQLAAAPWTADLATLTEEGAHCTFHFAKQDDVF